MRFLGTIDENKDLTTKEYVDENLSSSAYVLDFSITDLDSYILSSGGAFTITDISGLVQAVTSGKPLHIKYNDDYTGYYLVNGYIDGADVLSLEFDYNGNRYGVEADTVGGGADAFITEIGSSSISIDSELSDSSENPVQNKVVKAAIDNLTNEVIANEEVTAASLNDLNDRISVIEDGDVDISIDSELSDTSENPVQNKVVKAAIDNLTNEMIANEKVHAGAYNDLNERINAIAENVTGETATKVELQDAVTTLTNTILDNENVTAAALNDLHTKILSIIERVAALENV